MLHVEIAVGDDLIDAGAGRRQLLGQHLATAAGTHQQQPLGAGRGQRVGEGLGPISCGTRSARKWYWASASAVPGPMAASLSGPKSAKVAAGARQPIEKKAHAVGAGKHQPIVVGQPCQPGIDRPPVFRRQDLDGRLNQDLGAQLFEQIASGRRPVRSAA